MTFILIIAAGPFTSLAECEAAKPPVEAEIVRYECHVERVPAPLISPLPQEKP